MKVLCVFTQYNYGNPERGVSIEYASFLPAMKSLGHEVMHFETWDSARYPTYAEMNCALVEAAAEWKPDLIFTVQRDYEIWLETLETLSVDMGIALATWITDDSFKFKHYSRFIAPYYHGIGTTYDYRVKDYQRAGVHGALYTQWAANEQWLQAPKPAMDCAYKVTFIGTKYGERENLVLKLRSAGLDVTCFGFGWANGPTDTEQIPEIMRDSVISLNFSGGYRSDGGHDRQLKARTFEVPGAGGFLLSEYAPSIEQFYGIRTEIDVFDSPEELEQKIRFYLENPALRDSMAKAAYERTRAEHLYPYRLRELFDFALQRKAASTQHGAGRLLSQKLDNTASAGRPLNFLERLYRSIMVELCQLVWGQKRGLQAARRLTFELSVRLVGVRTFTAQGLPGRLFPYV